MPLVIHPRVRKLVAHVAALTCAAMFAGTGAALADGCPAQTLVTAFAASGDPSSYFLVPGGTFQPGDAAQWSLVNAAPTLDGAGVGSLAIAGGGSATSPWFCMDSTMSSFRFRVRQIVAGSDLRVQVLARLGPSPHYIRLTVARLSDGSFSTWTALAPLHLAGRLLAGGGSVQIALRFQATPGPGSWGITDVYVDPYRAG